MAIVNAESIPKFIPRVRSLLGHFQPSSDSLSVLQMLDLMLLSETCHFQEEPHRAPGKIQHLTPPALLLTLTVKLALLSLLFLWIILRKVMKMTAKRDQWRAETSTVPQLR